MKLTIDAELLSKLEAVAHRPDADLYKKIVETFYERIEEDEEFSAADWADIQERRQEVRRGEYLTLEELDKELEL
jgi:truncated hemoglobin YjbI